MLPKTGKNCALLLLCAFTLVLTCSALADSHESPKKGLSIKQRNDFHQKKSQIDSAHRRKKKRSSSDETAEEEEERKTKPRSRVSKHIADLKSRRALKLTPDDSSFNSNKNVNINVRIENVQQLTSHFYSAMKFRENCVRIFGYILQKAESSALNEEQYTALQLVHEAVREKRVYFFDLLPPLIYFLPGERPKGRNAEMELVLKILSKNLPKYLRCTAHYLVREFHYRNINMDKLVSILNPSPVSLDFFAGMEPSQLNASSLSRKDILRLQIEPIDESGKVTRTILGPVFVNLIDHVYQRKIDLSPEIFGLILANLPISPIDPILEGNLIYICELAKKGSLPKWNDVDVAAALLDKNPYNLVQRVITKLLKVQDTNSDVIEALLYISIHLSPAQSSGRANPGLRQIRGFDESDARSLVQLLRSIVYPEFSKDTLDARDKLIDLIERQRFNVQPIFLVVDRFAYDNPYDLLLAILITWKKLVAANPGADEFARPISLILANMIFKKRTIFSPTTPDDLFITDILPAILDDRPQTTTDLRLLTTTVIIRRDNWKSRDIIVSNRTQCVYPKQCLVNSFENWASLLTSDEDRRLVDRLKTSIVVDFQPFGQQYCPKDTHNVQIIEEKKHIQIVFPYFPDPTTPEELKMRNKLTIFIVSNGFVDPTKAGLDGRLTIKSKLLYEILQDILKMDVDALDGEIIHVVNYYLDLMKELQLIPSIIIRQAGRTEKELKIDLDSLIRNVIDYEKLGHQDRSNYLMIMRYIENNPTAINRSHLDLFKYKTKGKLARYILQRLADNDYVTMDIREAIRKLIPHVMLTGVGEERIFVKKVRTVRRMQKNPSRV